MSELKIDRLHKAAEEYMVADMQEREILARLDISEELSRVNLDEFNEMLRNQPSLSITEDDLDMAWAKYSASLRQQVEREHRWELASKKLGEARLALANTLPETRKP